MAEEPEKPFYEVTSAEFFKAVDQMRKLNGDDPIVKQVLTNAARIRSLELKFYAILAAVMSSAVLSAVVRWIPTR